jgi:hypothetical protein
MAFKLSKADSKLKDEHAANLRAAKERITVAENLMAVAVGALNEAIKNYNGVLADVKTFVDEHAEVWQAEHDDKSEKWQEGDRADAAKTLIGEWEEFEADDLDDVEMPDVPESGHADALDALPSEAQE